MEDNTIKVSYNSRSQMPEFIFEDKDYLDAANIKQMVDGQFVCRSCGSHNTNNAWSIVEGYFRSAREAIIESMKAGLKNRATRSLTDLKAAKLEGFDEAGRIPNKIIIQAEMMRIKEQAVKEVQSGDDE